MAEKRNDKIDKLQDNMEKIQIDTLLKEVAITKNNILDIIEKIPYLHT